MTATSLKTRMPPKRAESDPDRQSSAAPAIALPLTDEQVAALFEQFRVPPAGRLRIQNNRKKLPFRATKSSKFAGKLRYPSRKMGFVLEAEAFSTEYVALVEWEHDHDVLEIFPQPAERLLIEYKAPSGRPVKTYITPDAFRVTNSGFRYTECKTEDELEKLTLAMPERYVKQPDGSWCSPPAQVAAAAIGCTFEVRSTGSNNYVLVENLELLRDFYCAAPEVSPESRALLAQRFEGHAFVSAFDLIHVAPAIDADDLYALLFHGEVYFPIHALRLAQQERALFFRSEADWKAHELFMQNDRPDRRRPILRNELRPGDAFTWDGVLHSIVNVGDEAISAQADSGNSHLARLTYEQLDALEKSKKLQFHRTAEQRDRSEADERFARASVDDRREAVWRHEILFGVPSPDNELVDRKERVVFYWKSEYRHAQERWGNGFLGLLSKRHGNRQPKVDPATKELALTVIKEDWETIRCKGRRTSHGEYKNRAESSGLDAISYDWFCKLIKSREGHAQAVSRVGEKAAYNLEPHYLELSQTTPSHGTHSWHIGHIDHTPLPLKLLLADYTGFADTLWLTVLIGAHDRKIRAYYLSFDEPSSRSCMMVIRDCVRRHGRFFQIVVSDGGSDFISTHYETLLALLEATKRERPRGKPRFGSVCERVFGVHQDQFIKRLMGSTDIVEKHFRSVSPEVMPERHAVWLLNTFEVELERYLEEVHHTNYHTGLDMSPNQAEALSLKSHGVRKFRRIDYDDNFIAESCPAPSKGDVLVRPEGVKMNYRWFNGPALRQPGVLGTRIEARYDPWNTGLGKVYVGKKWHTVYSEHYAVFSELSERAIRFATESMRFTARKRGEKEVINAQNLARFLMSTEGREVTARQMRNDAEAEVHRAKNKSAAPKPAAQTDQGGTATNVIPLPTRSKASTKARSTQLLPMEDL